jgi:hypothetical protein
MSKDKIKVIQEYKIEKDGGLTLDKWTITDKSMSEWKRENADLRDDLGMALDEIARLGGEV